MQLSSMKSIFKVILTGTPLQNNLKELWTLLEFVQPNNTFELDKFEKLLADRLSTLTSDTAGDVTDQGVADILNTLHNILKPFFLRRTKKDVNLNLPLKKTVVIDCPLVLEQKDIYTSVLTKTLSVNRNKDELLSLKTEPSDEDDETPLINVNSPLVKDMNTPLVKDMNSIFNMSHM
uniref:Lymphoid-specific helicase n=1 Tax=Cacopsylla melanoneura TaxID=428564 RepID=A0A8D8T6B4_9HEMI